MIAIIDYGMGNLRSVQKALEKVGAPAQITQDAKTIETASKVVLPGVGAMAPAMSKLDHLHLIPVIQKVIQAGTPFLGICLGFQLLFETSSEGGETRGLGVLKGRVERFDKLKIPQIGWNQLHIRNGSSPILNGIADGASVYFCHSYYVKPDSRDIVATTTDYGAEFVSSVRQDNLYGVQFHPEKSQTVGLKILENFCKLGKDS